MRSVGRWEKSRARPPCRHPAGPHGFTLLEVLLALGLTLVVLMAVGMAVDFFIRGIETSRAAVEEAQLARALLHRIADDLCSAVRYDPINAEQLVTIDGLGNLPPADDSDEPPPSAGESPNSGSSADAASSSAGTSGDSGAAMPRSLPGLYGSRTELQVDISRLPRLDQYDYELVPAGDSPAAVDRLSDVKTVTYFVLDAAEGETSLGQPRRGLVRAELDRAVTAYAAETGSLDPALEFEPIAPEVAAVEFEYTDGQQWYDVWDSQEQQGLPLAVRITLYLYPVELRRGGLAWLAPNTAYVNSENFVAYSLLVRLPGSEPATGQAGATGSDSSSGDDTDADRNQMSGGAGGSGGGPGTGGAPGSGGAGSSGGGGTGGGSATPGGRAPSGGTPGRTAPGTFNPFSKTTSGGGPLGGKSR